MKEVLRTFYRSEMAIRAAENIVLPRKAQLYDLFEEILLETHLVAVVEKR
jgi:hypothetical protein